MHRCTFALPTPRLISKEGHKFVVFYPVDQRGYRHWLDDYRDSFLKMVKLIHGGLYLRLNVYVDPLKVEGLGIALFYYHARMALEALDSRCLSSPLPVCH